MYFQILGLSIWKEHFSLQILGLGWDGLLSIQVDSDYNDDDEYVGKYYYFDVLYFHKFKRLFYMIKRRFTAKSWLKKHKDDIKKNLEGLR